MANLKNEIDSIRDLISGKKIYERAFQTVHTRVEERIFAKGKDSNNTPIGRYSRPYLKTRDRKNYPQSVKVILQAESQMVNDFRFGIDSKGNFASGFSNNFNFKKSHWVEKTYDKDIFSLSDSEVKFMDDIVDKMLRKHLG